MGHKRILTIAQCPMTCQDLINLEMLDRFLWQGGQNYSTMSLKKVGSKRVRVRFKLRERNGSQFNFRFNI